MIRLGVVVNTGKREKPSKTEAVYFSSKTRIQSWIKDYKKYNSRLNPTVDR